MLRMLLLNLHVRDEHSLIVVDVKVAAILGFENLHCGILRKVASVAERFSVLESVLELEKVTVDVLALKNKRESVIHVQILSVVCLWTTIIILFSKLESIGSQDEHKRKKSEKFEKKS